ncbi:MAG: hypothetical protein OEW98_00105 [Betaproteobacteria bacterium]|nr:hypothetical protein [Betaproteobacteria bacterium]
MAAAKSKTTSTEISDILTVTTGTVKCHIVGDSPLIMNRISEKVWRELVLPRGKKGSVEKATTLKHDPVAEYRASPYTLSDSSEPTLLAVLSTAFKNAISTSALDMPGAKKAVVGRLTWVDRHYVGIYGVPKLFMTPVRSADMNRTPDIRTRALLPEWACVVNITFVQPLIRHQAVVNLLAAAGITMGIGDWRQQKGSGRFGQFRIVDADDADFLRIVREGGREQQEHAMAQPVAYDDQTRELLDWYSVELSRRQLRGVAS